MKRTDLMAKALGITTSINRKSREERSNQPSGLFGEDYNRLRDFAAQSFPAIEPLMPPRVTLYSGGNNTRWTQETYIEIDAFAQQIYEMLSQPAD
jgi:hypothetical protein